MRVVQQQRQPPHPRNMMNRGRPGQLQARSSEGNDVGWREESLQAERYHGNKGGLRRRDIFDPNCTATCSSFAEGEPLVVTVGAYIFDISQLDPVGQNAMIAGYFWLSWNSCVVLPDDMFPPFDTVVIDNQSALWALTLNTDLVNTCYGEDGSAYTCPTCNVPREGYSYVDYQFSASVKFTFDYNRYPLDEQELYIALADLESNTSRIIYVADPDTNYHPTVNVLGFEIEGVIAEVQNITGRSNYGYYDTNQPYSTYARAYLGIKIKRGVTYFYMKVLPPTVITLFASGVILFVDPLNIDTRLGSAITGLLTLVFLAVGFSDKVPDIADLTIIDWVFNWCYLLVLLIMFECVAISYYLRTVNKLMIKAEMGVPLHIHHPKPPLWRRLFRSNEGDPLMEDAILKERYEEGKENEEEKTERLKLEAEHLIRHKHHRARKVDLALACLALFLASVGTVVVILIAYYRV